MRAYKNQKTQLLDNAILELWLATMTYEPSYHAIQIWWVYQLLKTKTWLILLIFTDKAGSNSLYFKGFLHKAIY